MIHLTHADGREVRFPTLADVEYFFSLGALRRDWDVVELAAADALGLVPTAAVAPDAPSAVPTPTSTPEVTTNG